VFCEVIVSGIVIVSSPAVKNAGRSLTAEAEEERAITFVCSFGYPIYRGGGGEGTLISLPAPVSGRPDSRPT
jgi:hypothetical protein